MPTMPSAVAALLASQRGIATSRQLNAAGFSERRIGTAVRHRQLIRLHRGAYVLAEVWDAAPSATRHCLQLLLVQQAAPDAVGWGPTATAGWRLPVRLLPAEPIVARPLGFGSAAGARVRRLMTSPEDIVEWYGMLLTSLPATVLDIAATSDLADALMTIDAALRRGVRLDSLIELANRRPPQCGRDAALAALEAADPGSESGLESLSRGRTLEVDLPRPLCNVELRVGSRYARVDLLWVEHGVAGECDGKTKYDDPATVTQVRWREKRRHEWVEALGFELARWGHPEVADDGRQMWQRVDRAMRIQSAVGFSWPQNVTAVIPMPAGVDPHPWVVAEVRRLQALGYPITIVDARRRRIV